MDERRIQTLEDIERFLAGSGDAILLVPGTGSGDAILNYPVASVPYDFLPVRFFVQAATVMPEMAMLGAALEPNQVRSEPTWLILANISFRFPAMVMP